MRGNGNAHLLPDPHPERNAVYQPPPNAPIPPARPIHRNISHTAWFIITLLTFGIAAPLWAIAAVVTSSKNKRMEAQYAKQLAAYNYYLQQHANQFRPPN